MLKRRRPVARHHKTGTDLFSTPGSLRESGKAYFPGKGRSLINQPNKIQQYQNQHDSNRAHHHDEHRPAQQAVKPVGVFVDRSLICRSEREG